MCLTFDNPNDITHTLSPYTSHLTEVTCESKLDYMKSIFNEIFTHSSMVKEFRVYHDLTPEELLPLVSNLPKLEKLVKLVLSFSNRFLQDVTNLSVLNRLRSCPLLTELTLRTPSFQFLEVPSFFFSSLESLLAGKVKVLTLYSIFFP